MAKPTAYNQRDPNSWTRVDMLLALYGRGIEHMEAALAATQAGDNADNLLHRTRAAAIVAAIRSGIVVEYGDVPQKIDQLCEFVQSCLVAQDKKQLQSALKVMSNLRDGFEGIRDEANRLEATGEIPPLSTAGTVDTTV